MAKIKDYFIEISDLESIERALINAEVEYNIVSNKSNQSVTTENGIVFKFDKDGLLLGLKAIEQDFEDREEEYED